MAYRHLEAPQPKEQTIPFGLPTPTQFEINTLSDIHQTQAIEVHTPALDEKREPTLFDKLRPVEIPDTQPRIPERDIKLMNDLIRAREPSSDENKLSEYIDTAPVSSTGKIEPLLASVLVAGGEGTHQKKVEAIYGDGLPTLGPDEDGYTLMPHLPDAFAGAKTVGEVESTVNVAALINMAYSPFRPDASETINDIKPKSAATLLWDEADGAAANPVPNSIDNATNKYVVEKIQALQKLAGDGTGRGDPNIAIEELKKINQFLYGQSETDATSEAVAHDLLKATIANPTADQISQLTEVIDIVRIDQTGRAGLIALVHGDKQGYITEFRDAYRECSQTHALLQDVEAKRIKLTQEQIDILKSNYEYYMQEAAKRVKPTAQIDEKLKDIRNHPKLQLLRTFEETAKKDFKPEASDAAGIPRNEARTRAFENTMDNLAFAAGLKKPEPSPADIMIQNMVQNPQFPAVRTLLTGNSPETLPDTTQERWREIAHTDPLAQYLENKPEIPVWLAKLMIHGLVNKADTRAALEQHPYQAEVSQWAQQTRDRNPIDPKKSGISTLPPNKDVIRMFGQSEYKDLLHAPIVNEHPGYGDPTATGTALHNTVRGVLTKGKDGVDVLTALNRSVARKADTYALLSARGSDAAGRELLQNSAQNLCDLLRASGAHINLGTVTESDTFDSLLQRANQQLQEQGIQPTQFFDTAVRNVLRLDTGNPKANLDLEKITMQPKNVSSATKQGSAGLANYDPLLPTLDEFHSMKTFHEDLNKVPVQPLSDKATINIQILSKEERRIKERLSSKKEFTHNLTADGYLFPREPGEPKSTPLQLAEDCYEAANSGEAFRVCVAGESGSGKGFVQQGIISAGMELSNAHSRIPLYNRHGIRIDPPPLITELMFADLGHGAWEGTKLNQALVTEAYNQLLASDVSHDKAIAFLRQSTLCGMLDEVDKEFVTKEDKDEYGRSVSRGGQHKDWAEQKMGALLQIMDTTNRRTMHKIVHGPYQSDNISIQSGNIWISTMGSFSGFRVENARRQGRAEYEKFYRNPGYDMKNLDPELVSDILMEEFMKRLGNQVYVFPKLSADQIYTLASGPNGSMSHMFNKIHSTVQTERDRGALPLNFSVDDILIAGFSGNHNDFSASNAARGSVAAKMKEFYATEGGQTQLRSMKKFDKQIAGPITDAIQSKPLGTPDQETDVIRYYEIDGKNTMIIHPSVVTGALTLEEEAAPSPTIDQLLQHNDAVSEAAWRVHTERVWGKKEKKK